MELGRMSLADFIKIHPRETLRSICPYLTIQMLSSINQLHNSGHYHLDIKPENFVFDQDFNLKLIDFDFCTTKNMMMYGIGTERYNPIEL